MGTNGVSLFSIPSLSVIGQADQVFQLPILGRPINPVSLSDVPEGWTHTAVNVVLEEGIADVWINFHCPVGFALVLQKEFYTHVTVKCVWTPEGSQYQWVQFGDGNKFKVINR